MMAKMMIIVIIVMIFGITREYMLELAHVGLSSETSPCAQDIILVPCAQDLHRLV